MSRKISTPPGWLGVSEDRTSFIFLPDRASIVRRVFELSIAGLGGYTIAKHLNAENVPAFGRSKKWDQSTIHNMLTSRATVGEHQPKTFINGKGEPIGCPIPGYYPAVIDEYLFRAAQDARRKHLASGRGRKGRLITNLFSGLTTCFYCGSEVWFHSNGNKKSLMCAAVYEGRGCHRRAWSYGNFEASFFNMVKRLGTDPTICEEERKVLVDLGSQIDQLAGTEVYNARLHVSMTLKHFVSELKLACAGPAPKIQKSLARIRRDEPDRFFSFAFCGGIIRVGHPI